MTISNLTAQRPSAAFSSNSRFDASLSKRLQSGTAATANLDLTDTLSREQKAQLDEDRGVATRLKEALEQGDDDLRMERINRLKEKIAALKERLKFATPEQAEKLIKELKQISKEFGQAAKSLNGGGTGVGVQTSITSTQALTTTSATTASTAATVSAAISAPAETDPVLASPGTRETANQPLHDARPSTSATDQPGPVQDAFAAYSNAAAATFLTENNASERAGGYSSLSVRQAHSELLREIQDELKSIAGRIERLAKNADEKDEKDLEEAKEELEKAGRELDAFQAASQHAIATGTGIPGNDQTTANAGTSTSTGLSIPLAQVPAVSVSAPAPGIPRVDLTL